MIHVVVVNFHRPVETLTCLSAAAERTQQPFSLLLVDNDPRLCPEQEALLAFVRQHGVRYVANATNVGFAAACNQVIEILLREGGADDSVVLLNNDALPLPSWLSDWPAELSGVEMVAIPMFSLADPARVDSLGVALYQGGFAANRLHPDVPLLGPCGGAALYRLSALRRIQAETGELFPTSFFCYSEDTDLAIRACLLGMRCAQAPGPGVLHHGSLSAGGATSAFVMFHGLRNSLRTLHRCVPGWVLLRNMPWIVLGQLAVMVKYARGGQLRLLCSVYQDVAAHWRADLAVRRRLKAAGLLRAKALAGRLARGLYPSSYLMKELRTLVGGAPRGVQA